MKVTCQVDCGNSPKREFLKELSQLFAAYEIDLAMSYMDEDIHWTLVGDQAINGKENFAAALREHSDNKVKELILHSIITHGKEAAVYGEMLMENAKHFVFADIYTFKSAKGNKVKSIVSFVQLKSS
ncbi:PB1 domain-containing protein [Croceimicrobium hydrocarbonivorans]|uniref:Nuclear transport factor 2 family protein n=1 Tax=Croceimicrobium hydrocarbonivorans TaxID=2761580 RepID=A0A7H0VIB2_9FLAO|nr:nuclear transport factor 2 family protein [Croceimicrobium hydrocarbonivorans]QNR25460.1 nuclear transport factor 2 family protein [Croceimicrobium hydrocarbonivorans]